MDGTTPPQGTKIDNISLIEIIRLIHRKKGTLFLSILIMVILATFYNFLATPIYDATTIIKKEDTYDKKSTDLLRNIIVGQTADGIETEMEIIKTATVLKKVVNALNLNFIIEKLDLPDGSSVKINKNLLDFKDFRLETKYAGEALPSFYEINSDSGYKASGYYIGCSADNVFKLYESSTDNLIQTVNSSSGVEFNLSNIHIAFNWPNAKKGSKFYFRITNLDKTVQKLGNNVSLARVGETDIFKITVSSKSPFAAQKIANTIVKEFRLARLEQKRQTIRYSYNFIDEQTENISAKLKDAEAELHEFKSANQIVSIDESSKKAIQFLSDLEAEKVKTDLELAEYQNKLEATKKELEEKGFFDQTYLSPDEAHNNQTPFSALLQQLSNAELERLELLQKRTENHPEVIAIDDRIDQIKEKLSSYTQNTITAYEIKIATLEDKQSKLTEMIKKYSDIIKGLPGDEVKLAELMRARNVYEKMLTFLLDKKEEMRMAELSQLQDFVVIDAAVTPLDAASPNKRFNLAIAVFLGLFIGVAVVFAKRTLGQKIQDVEEAEEIVEKRKVPLLTILPKYDNKLQKVIQNGRTKEDYLVNLMEDQQGYVESYNLLATKLMHFVQVEEKTLMITSCEENAGKTSVTANLAIALAKMDKKVLVIDCDLKKSEMGVLFDIVGKDSRFAVSGLGEYLGKNIKPNISRPFQYPENDAMALDIFLAGSSQGNSSTLLASPKMKGFVEKAKRSYDYILIDTPPVTRTVDTFVLGEFIKDIILVIRPNHTFTESVLWALREFERSGINVLGAVANACELSKSYYRHIYDYGYGYGKKTGITI